MKKIALFLALASVSLFAKSYDLTFHNPAILGSVEVPAGQYQLKFEGSKVTLTNLNNGKKLDAIADVETVDKAFTETTVQSKKVEGKDMVDEIQIGGTKTALNFKH
jgi:hypothetical protein